MSDTDLSALPQHVREALGVLDGEAVCTCHEDYTSRDMKDPQCNHDLAEYVQTIRTELLRVCRENRILEIKNAGTLANNLCPDHRDKQTGKPCLACTIETLTRQKERAESELAQMKAERDAVLASNRDCMDWFKQMRADYYALRKRIAEAPIYEMPLRKPTDEAGWCGVIASAKALKDARGKRIALLTVTAEDKA